MFFRVHNQVLRFLLTRHKIPRKKNNVLLCYSKPTSTRHNYKQVYGMITSTRHDYTYTAWLKVWTDDYNLLQESNCNCMTVSHARLLHVLLHIYQCYPRVKGQLTSQGQSSTFFSPGICIGLFSLTSGWEDKSQIIVFLHKFLWASMNPG